MNNIDLTRIALGSPAAERDVALHEYFVKSDAYRRVASENKRIVIGNRGVGKSAIFEFIASEYGKKPNTSVIRLSPEDYSYELLSESMVGESEGSWKKQSAYGAAWKYLLYVLAMKSIVNDVKLPSRNAELSKIKKYIRDHHQGGQRSPFDALISYLKRLEGIKIGNYEAAIKSRELEKLYKLEEINALVPALQEVLRRHTIIILVDELDRGWDASEDAQAFVAGLFQACLALNSTSPNLRLYMSLRQELYENIPALYEDAQKVRDLIETIRWDEKGLKTLIVQRIRHSLLQTMSSEEVGTLLPSEDAIWAAIYSEALAYRKTNSFNYIVDRTLYRPREIIQFCSIIVEQGRQQTFGPLDYQTFVEAESIYSEERAKDIAAEYRFQYPGLVKIFESFRGKTYTFDRSALEEECLEIIVAARPESDKMDWLEALDTDKMIEVLWRIGFLKAQNVGGIKGKQRSGSQYLGFFQQPSLSLTNVTRFQVHPMFRSWLGMKEPKGSVS